MNYNRKLGKANKWKKWSAGLSDYLQNRGWTRGWTLELKTSDTSQEEGRLKPIKNH